MKKFGSIFLCIVLSVVYGHWFINKEIIGGDWPYFPIDLLRGLSFFVPSWMPYQINGFGGPSVLYALDSYFYALTSLFVRVFSIPWPVVYKGAYFGFFLVLAYTSSRFFLSKLVPVAQSWQRDIASFLYTTNTFILMIVGGGQMGIALAYATAPLVLGAAIHMVHAVTENKISACIRQIIIVGLLYALLTLFDARVTFLVLYAHALYIVVHFFQSPKLVISSVVVSIGIVGSIVFLLHAGWILPMIVFRFTPYDYLISKSTGIGSLLFYSFASFSNGLSLLHPNWPENVFGKVYFMRPEFIFIPIVAFMSLLGVTGQKDRLKRQNILYCGLLVIIGAFLAKGAQGPLGELNLWIYTNVPGFSMFRDPTKFYLYVALGYLVLLPIGLEWLALRLARKIPRIQSTMILCIILTVFIAYWGVIIREALTQQLGGTFRTGSVPNEYRELDKHLSADNSFYRTLWYPRQQRFAYYTNLHPAVEANHFFQATNSAQLAGSISRPDAQEKIKSAAIKFIIVPYDSEGEIFTNDRKYDEDKWQEAVKTLDRVPWFINKQLMGRLVVYEVPNPYGRFRLVQNGIFNDQNIAYLSQGTTRYSLVISGPGELIFSESFNPSWMAKINGATISSIRTRDGYNSFVLPETGTHAIDIYFDQENAYTYGRWVSLATFIILIGVWVFVGRGSRKKYEN